MSENKQEIKYEKAVFCEARDCNEVTEWHGKIWRKQWLSVWVEDLNMSLAACSYHCAKEIEANRYQILNSRPKPTDAPMKAEQIKLL
jgi:hypothetical protein